MVDSAVASFLTPGPSSGHHAFTESRLTSKPQNNKTLRWSNSFIWGSQTQVTQVTETHFKSIKWRLTHYILGKTEMKGSSVVSQRTCWGRRRVWSNIFVLELKIKKDIYVYVTHFVLTFGLASCWLLKAHFQAPTRIPCDRGHCKVTSVNTTALCCPRWTSILRPDSFPAFKCHLRYKRLPPGESPLEPRDWRSARLFRIRPPR